MSEAPDETTISFSEIALEAVKRIRSEILAYAVVMAALLIGSATLGLDVLRELKWPLVVIFTAALAAYFFARAVPRARIEITLRRSRAAAPTPASPPNK